MDGIQFIMRSAVEGPLNNGVSICVSGFIRHSWDSTRSLATVIAFRRTIQSGWQCQEAGSEPPRHCSVKLRPTGYKMIECRVLVPNISSWTAWCRTVDVHSTSFQHLTMGQYRQTSACARPSYLAIVQRNARHDLSNLPHASNVGLVVIKQ